MDRPVEEGRSLDRMLRLAEVQIVCGLSKATIYRSVRNGAFPAPMKLSLRASGWSATDIEKWLKSRQCTRPIR